MTEPTIFGQIRKEQKDFMNDYIQIVPGYVFNQYETIKRAHLYLNSKYENESQFLGRDKIFFNVVLAPCEVAMRMLNIDTKNIKLWATEEKSYFSTYLLEKELKQWLKKHKLGKVLNKIAEEAPRFGSVVMEKTPEGAEVIDLRRLALDPTVENIQDSRFVTTTHYMTPSQLRDTNWEDVEVAIERFGTYSAPDPYEDESGNMNVMRSTPYIKVTKRYGEVPAWWLGDSAPGTKAGDKLVRSLFIVAGADQQSINADGKPTGELGVILFKGKWTKKWPFKDFHYMKTKGRWLGVGVVEMLFDVQMRVNEIKNQKRLSMEISSMHLFQTRDKSIVRNVLTDMLNGDILLTNSEMTPIANEERNLAAFQDEEVSYSQQADRLSFAYEAIRGEDAGAETLGQTQIVVAQATSVYAFKKENLGLFLQDFFNDLVLPQLLKDLSPEHMMRFVGSVQELEKLDQAAAEIYANDYVLERILNGESVKIEEQAEAKQRAIDLYRKTGESRFLKIKDAFYDDVQFEFDFMITGEQENPNAIANSIQQVLGTIMGNPQALNDPRVKVLYYKFAEKLGVNPAELELADQQASELQNKQLQVEQQQAIPPANPPQKPSNNAIPNGIV